MAARAWGKALRSVLRRINSYMEQALKERDRFCDELQFAWTLGIEMAEASPEGKAERLCAALRVATISRNWYYYANVGGRIWELAFNGLKRLASESPGLRFQIARAILEI